MLMRAGPRSQTQRKRRSGPHLLRFGAMLLTAALAVPAPADTLSAAHDQIASTSDASLPPLAGFGMAEGREVRGPRAFYELCARSPQECPAPTMLTGPAQLTLDQRAWRLLTEVNRAVNETHAPRLDVELYGVSDHWTRPMGYADCEDYALAKRAALIAEGAPAEALLIGVVEGIDDEYHAVLIVRTDRGDLVLDNLEPDVRLWTATKYTWVIRQSAADPARWVRIVGAEDPNLPRILPAERWAEGATAG